MGTAREPALVKSAPEREDRMNSITCHRKAKRATKAGEGSGIRKKAEATGKKRSGFKGRPYKKRIGLSANRKGQLQDVAARKKRKRHLEAARA